MGIRARLMVLAGLMLMMLAALPPAQAQSLEVIDLHHRRAEDVIPILQPLLEAGGALSGQDYQLFVRASRTNVSQLREVLAAIDRAPRQLLISVRSNTRGELEQERAAAGGRIGPDGGSVSVQATQSARNRQGEGIASVRVLEGGTASIATGQTVPVVTAFAVGTGSKPFAAGSLGYRDLSSGYLVTPRLAGEQVTLQIEQQSQQPVSQQGTATTQTLSTQVSGRLGTWIALGGIDESSSATTTGVLSRRYQTQSSERMLWVKVELAE
jgi:hypothetical protein